MEMTWSPDLVFWITVVELPALTGLFWLIMRVRRDLDTQMRALHRDLLDMQARLFENLIGRTQPCGRSAGDVTSLRPVDRPGVIRQT